MRFIKDLSTEEKILLKNIHKTSHTHASRRRASAILLSHKGYTLNELSKIFDICRQTAASWLNAWAKDGESALSDKPRSGRPFKLLPDIKQEAIEWVTEHPRSLKTVLAQLSEKHGITVSRATLKRICKQAKLCWKRVRRSLRSKRNPDLFAASQKQLAALTEQAKQQTIDLVYFDESGFTLEPCIPYAWQPVGETIEVPCAKSKRLNVLGFMNKNGSFQSWVFEQSVTSAVVIACFDTFIDTLKRPTTIVIDNAPIHTSQEFKDNLDRWEKHGVTILPIAAYSPELNLIEMLWRKIKYEWMPFSAYSSFLALKQNLFEILANIGSSYCIKFA